MKTQSQPAKQDETFLTTIFTVDDLNRLNSSVTSIRIKSLNFTMSSLRTSSSRLKNPILPNENVTSIEIEGHISTQRLLNVLESFTGLHSLSVCVDDLCFGQNQEYSSDDDQPMELQNIHRLRIINSHRCPNLLEWILSWRINHLKRLVVCKADIDNENDFQHLHDFVNGTSSDIEEIVLQDTNLCKDCNFYDIKLDRLKEIAVLSSDDGKSRKSKRNSEDDMDNKCVS